VHLTDHNIRAELTAGLRAGLHRYTFHGEGNGHLLVDFAHGFHDDYKVPCKVTDAELRLVGNDTLVGTSPRASMGRWAIHLFCDESIATVLASNALFGRRRRTHRHRRSERHASESGVAYRRCRNNRRCW
jgi:putative alpha-1,2-mannosidase